MFNYLYEKYKTNVLKSNVTYNINRMTVIEIMLIVAGLIGALLMLVSLFVKSEKLEVYSTLITVVLFVILLIYQSVRTLSIEFIEKKLKHPSEERMKRVVAVLTDCEIDVEDMNQLNALIERAEKEKDRYDYFKEMKSAFLGVGIYGALPAIAIVIADRLKTPDTFSFWFGVIKYALLGLLIVIIISDFTKFYNNFVISDVYKLDSFIRDIENIKAFSKKVKRFADKANPTDSQEDDSNESGKKVHLKAYYQ